jgi:hypothetical protein
MSPPAGAGAGGTDGSGAGGVVRRSTTAGSGDDPFGHNVSGSQPDTSSSAAIHRQRIMASTTREAPRAMQSLDLIAAVSYPRRMDQTVETKLPIRLDALRQAALVTDPFAFVYVPGFVAPELFERVHDDFPLIDTPGSHPVDVLTPGPAFRALVAALEGPELRRAVEAKFGLSLADRPTMVTVRGMARDRDGSIHTDSETKIITLLIYCNRRWDHAGGRLRLLRRADDVEDFVLEIPPVAGNMVMFQRSTRSFHGHLPASEPRRSLQLNWMVDRAARDRELARHRRTAWVKRLNPFR